MEWLGYASAIFHLFVTNTFIVLIIVSHTIYPALWFKIVLFILLLILFVQHVLLGGCVMTMFEKHITSQDESPFRKLLEKIFVSFGLTLEQYDTYFLVILATSLLWMGLEILSILCSCLSRAWH
jgi:hypothetical protein